MSIRRIVTQIRAQIDDDDSLASNSFFIAKQVWKACQKDKVSVAEVLMLLAAGRDGKPNTNDDLISQDTLRKLLSLVNSGLLDDYLESLAAPCKKMRLPCCLQ